MNRLPNWYYLTGSVAALQQVWNSYGVLVEHGRRLGQWSPTAISPS